MGKLMVGRTGAIGTITISNPEKRNAMTGDMWSSVPPSLQELDADSSVRAIVVRGEGDVAFISGADTSQFRELRNTPDKSKQYSTVVEAAVLAPAQCSKLVVADIRGHCIGGGLAFAAGCDIRLASDHALFRMPAARLGLGYPPASLQAFVCIMGASNTLDIFGSARQFDAADAKRMGFVSQVHPRADMDGAVEEYAIRVAESAPLTVAAIKFAVRQLLRAPGDRDMKKADAMAKACFASEDHQEGRNAIAEKRSPRFTGK